MAYLHKGNLEIDNNLMENALLPVALGGNYWLYLALIPLPRASSSTARYLPRAMPIAFSPTTRSVWCCYVSTSSATMRRMPHYLRTLSRICPHW